MENSFSVTELANKTNTSRQNILKLIQADRLKAEKNIYGEYRISQDEVYNFSENYNTVGYVTKKQFGRICNIGKQKTDKLIDNGTLQVKIVGKRTYISVDEVNNYKQEKHTYRRLGISKRKEKQDTIQLEKEELKGYVTIKEAMKVLNRKRMTITRYFENGNLQKYMNNGKVYVSKKEISDILKYNK